MKNDSHSILWIPGIKLRVVNIGPQAWQQGPLLAQPPPPHHPDYTQFCFFYSSPGLSLSFLPVPFLFVSVPHCSGAQGTLHFTQRVTTLFVKPWLSDFRTL